MRRNGWKLLLIGCLMAGGGTYGTPIAAKAQIFLEQYERLSNSERKVGIWERVVYSLMEVNQQTRGTTRSRIG